jgi:hypothetical protein
MTTVSEFLAHYPPSIQKLAEELQALIVASVPAATASVNLGWCSISFRHPKAGYFCGLFPKPACVQVLLEFGVLLPDPEHLLEGNGRQVRYVTVRPETPLPAAALRTFFDAALDLPPGRAAKMAMIEVVVQ